MIYKIVNQYVQCKNIEIDLAWKKFQVKNIENCLHNKCTISVCFERQEFDLINLDMSIALARNIQYIFSADNQWMLVNKDYTRAFVQDGSKETHNIFLNHLFYSHAVKRKMVQMHCSMVEDNGCGILFLGPSGIGKTTQAERWEQYHESVIINGDVGYVQQTGDGFLAWGTPWHGSSPYCVNTSVPLKAMVVLKQSEKNELRELSGFEKVREVSGNVFYPTWLENGVELCANTLFILLNSVPVYCLDNRADEEAVKLLAKEIDRIT